MRQFLLNVNVTEKISVEEIRGDKDPCELGQASGRRWGNVWNNESISELSFHLSDFPD